MPDPGGQNGHSVDTDLRRRTKPDGPDALH